MFNEPHYGCVAKSDTFESNSRNLYRQDTVNESQPAPVWSSRSVPLACVRRLFVYRDACGRGAGR